ncbi:MAG: DASH family cryptochrome [Bacteroidia bacterium]|nr:DASH family cryptochrome [Bacteroidia bacterium]
MKRAIHWFRNDLRLHDNEALSEAIKNNDEVIPIYILDPRIFSGKTSYGFHKTGPYRLKFILESLSDLRKQLKEHQTTLYIREGLPEVIIPQITRQFNVQNIYCNRERTKEEVEVQDALEKKLWSIGREVRYYRGKMLYHTADLPFPVTHCPDSFSVFKKEVERIVNIREPLNFPAKRMRECSIEMKEGHIPDISYFGFSDQKTEKGLSFTGGETEGLIRLEYYIWKSKSIQSYNQNKFRMLDMDYSSKLSPYLSQGCISPKLIYHEILRFEKEYGKNDSTTALKLELLWRDFFRLMGKKHGSRIFRILGPGERNPPSTKYDHSFFLKWKEGKTGVPFIDANMKEMNQTGYMSNRGRQIVSCFLVNDMEMNWIAGAEYFESMLIDYDPCSNYGNWNYIAGVSATSKDNPNYYVPSQARKYDPQADYIKYWLPDLKPIDPRLLFNPFENRSSVALSKARYTQPCDLIRNW